MSGGIFSLISCGLQDHFIGTYLNNNTIYYLISCLSNQEKELLHILISLKCKVHLQKKLDAINDVPSNISSLFNQYITTSSNNPDMFLTNYLDSWNDIMSLLCCSKTMYDYIINCLNIEKNRCSILNISPPDRKFNIYWYSKRDFKSLSFNYIYFQRFNSPVYNQSLLNVKLDEEIFDFEKEQCKILKNEKLYLVVVESLKQELNPSYKPDKKTKQLIQSYKQKQLNKELNRSYKHKQYTQQKYNKH